uniref:Uncharacterized protein n=1 Tax=Leersia perrieri TaxID=77586 RepID=A0A0D9W2J1_9ORYZ
MECPVMPYGSSTLGGLATKVDVLAKGIMEVPGEVDKVSKDSSYDLARQVMSLILASYQARDPGFNPYVPTDDFPEGMEEDARRCVADAIEAIMDFLIIHTFAPTWTQ